MLTKKRLITICVVVGLLLGGVVFVVSLKNAGALVTGYPITDTREGRLEFIASHGWEVDAASEEKKDVHIPAVFDAVYTRYNDLQRSQGLDLLAVAGKDVIHYSYTVTNYPDSDDVVKINLLVYKGRVIGGDIMSTALDGFMHPF